MSVEVIAELCSNFVVGNQDENKSRLFEMIDIAAQSGATAIKLQLFKADKLYRDPKRIAQLKQYELPVDWLPDIKQSCDNNGIEFLCTPFYVEAVGELSPFVERWKIASGDLTYEPLLDRISQDDRPVLLSTGFGTVQEIQAALNTLEPLNVTLLHCTGGYPTPIHDMNLRRLLDLGEHFFPHDIGFSSHTPVPYLVAASVLYGARVIEVHFDLDDKRGIEAGHSFTPGSFAELVKVANEFEQAKTCGCDMTLDDTVQRTQARRDPSDWLRTVK